MKTSTKSALSPRKLKHKEEKRAKKREEKRAKKEIERAKRKQQKLKRKSESSQPRILDAPASTNDDGKTSSGNQNGIQDAQANHLDLLSMILQKTVFKREHLSRKLEQVELEISQLRHLIDQQKQVNEVSKSGESPFDKIILEDDDSDAKTIGLEVPKSCDASVDQSPRPKRKESDGGVEREDASPRRNRRKERRVSPKRKSPDGKQETPKGAQKPHASPHHQKTRIQQEGSQDELSKREKLSDDSDDEEEEEDILKQDRRSTSPRHNSPKLQDDFSDDDNDNYDDVSKRDKPSTSPRRNSQKLSDYSSDEEEGEDLSKGGDEESISEKNEMPDFPEPRSTYEDLNESSSNSSNSSSSTSEAVEDDDSDFELEEAE